VGLKLLVAPSIHRILVTYRPCIYMGVGRHVHFSNGFDTLIFDVESLISYINNIVESCMFGLIEVYILFDGRLCYGELCRVFLFVG
jgi:hypothetical protein